MSLLRPKSRRLSSPSSDSNGVSEFTDVIALQELPLGGQRCLQVSGFSLLLCHTDSGVYVLENRCPHVAMPLEGGFIEGDVIRCPAHGATFNIVTGVPTRARRLGSVKVFENEIRHNRIWVNLQ